MRNLSRLVMVTAVALCVVVPATAAGASGRVPDPILVSRTNPFAGCTVGGTPTSVNYPGAEVEPSIATNRRHPREIVGVWQQDRWNDGGAHGIVSAFSADGGRS